jgi:hypothetical protein
MSVRIEYGDRAGSSVLTASLRVQGWQERCPAKVCGEA